MKIRVGKYTLESDRYCMWITEEYEGEDKDGKVKMQNKRVAGYSTSFPLLMRSFAQNKALESDATTMGKLIKDLSEVYEDMLKFDSVAVEQDFRKVGSK